VVNFVFRHRALPKRLIGAVVRGPVLLNLPDFKLYVRLDDWAVGARIAVKRTYEPHVSAALRPYLTPGAVALDIGANIGYHALHAAARVGPAGRVIAFEPSADNCALLRRSARANGFDHLVVHERAVADRNGTVGLGLDDSNGQVSATDFVTYPIRVEAVALDDFLRDEPRLDVVKMDIEGAEGLALRGMASLVARCRPILLSELNPGGLRKVSGMEPEAYLDQLRDLGYDLWVVSRQGPLSAAPESNAEILSRFAGGGLDHIDLRALPKRARG
jgi:FkbM family methyltransferase